MSDIDVIAPTNDSLSFTFGAHNLRALMVDGEPWFVAGDVAKALGYRDAHNMGRRLDTEDRGTHSLSTPGGMQSVAIVSEPGLYMAILGSQIEGAKDFKRWVTREVLPTLRRTGTFNSQTREQRFALAVAEAQQMLTEKDQQIAVLAPKAEFYDDLMMADGTYEYLAVAKIIGWGRNTMLAQLRKLGVLQSNNLPYRRYEHHFKVVPQTYVNRKTGETVPTATAYVRPSGIDFLRKKLTGSDLVVAP